MTDTVSVEADEAVPNAITVPAFRLLWFNNITYFLVINAQRFVFGWLVLDGLGRNEQSQALAVFALGIPSLFLVLPAGVWSDRWDRRRLLLVSQLGSAVVMGVTAALVGTEGLTFGLVIALALVAGGFAAIGGPVRQALVPALVGSKQLLSAIALTAIAMTMSLIFGPVLVKLVGDRFGFDGAFWFLTGLLIVGTSFIFRLVVPSRVAAAAKQKSSVRSDLAEAVRFVFHHRSLRTLFLLLTVSGLTVNPAVMVTTQALIKEDLGRDAGDAAPVLAMMGAGVAISSVFVMRKGGMARKGQAFQFALMVGSSMTFLMGQVGTYWQLLPLNLFMGLAGGFYINMNQGLIQGNTSEALMGRVMGLYTLIQVGFFPLGALALGGLAGVIGIGNAISAAGAVMLATVLAVYVTDKDLRHLA